MPETTESGPSVEPTRSTPREGDNPRPRAPFSPTNIMLDGHNRTIREKNVTIGALIVGLIITCICVISLQSEQKVIVIDPVGGVTQGPVEPLASSKGYFGITSINATQVALQRSTVGYDLQELLPMYFTNKARKKLDEDQKGRAEDIRHRRLSFKPVIESITSPQSAGDARIVRVTGRVQTTGLVNSRLFYDEPPFEMILTYRVNGDLANKAAMPWLVDDIDIAVNTEEVTALHERNKLKQ